LNIIKVEHHRLTFIATWSQLSRARWINLQASPHPLEAAFEYRRVSRLALNLLYELAQAAPARQSHKNVVYARLGLVCQKEVGRELALFKICSKSIAAPDARKANAVIPNGGYQYHREKL
jgi:hypothetical protein